MSNPPDVRTIVLSRPILTEPLPGSADGMAVSIYRIVTENLTGELARTLENVGPLGRFAISVEVRWCPLGSDAEEKLEREWQYRCQCESAAVGE